MAFLERGGRIGGNGTTTYDIAARTESTPSRFTYDKEAPTRSTPTRLCQFTQVTERFDLALDYSCDSAANQTQVINSEGDSTALTNDADNFLTHRTLRGRHS